MLLVWWLAFAAALWARVDAAFDYPPSDDATDDIWDGDDNDDHGGRDAG